MGAKQLLIQTSRFGEVQIDSQKVINFPAGIPGFPEEHRFVLLKQGLEETPFWWLQSVTEGSLSFLLVEPTQAFADYAINLPEQTLQELSASVDAPLEALLMVTVPEGDLRQATANLKAPIVINPASRLGVQAILEQAQFPIRQPLFPEAGV